MNSKKLELQTDSTTICSICKSDRRDGREASLMKFIF